MWTTIYEGAAWKPCTNCKTDKPVSDFSRVTVGPKTRKDGLSSWCRLCYSQHFKKAPIAKARLQVQKEYFKRPYVKKQRQATYRRHDMTPNSRYSYLLISAKKRNIPMTVSFVEWTDLTSKDSCHYCGGTLGTMGHSLDRKYNEIGYTLENVVACCGECNFMKRRMPYHEFVLLSPALREIKKLRQKNPAVPG
jgi:5-methylcytosine-specific restriction endonuclease McrA